jgi:hypothetical protein
LPGDFIESLGSAGSPNLILPRCFYLNLRSVLNASTQIDGPSGTGLVSKSV